MMQLQDARQTKVLIAMLAETTAGRCARHFLRCRRGSQDHARSQIPRPFCQLRVGRGMDGGRARRADRVRRPDHPRPRLEASVEV
jgi:hypothetical protein